MSKRSHDRKRKSRLKKALRRPEASGDKPGADASVPRDDSSLPRTADGGIDAASDVFAGDTLFGWGGITDVPQPPRKSGDASGAPPPPRKSGDASGAPQPPRKSGAASGAESPADSRQDASPGSCHMRNCTRIVSQWLSRLAASRSVTARNLFCADMTAWRAQLNEKLEKLGMNTASLPFDQQLQLARTVIWCEEPWLSIIPRAAEAFESELNKTLHAGPLPPVMTDVQVTYLPLGNSLWRTGRAVRADHGAARITIAITDLFLLDESGKAPRRLAKFLAKLYTQKSRADRSESSRALQEKQALRRWVSSEKVLAYLQALERHTTYSSHQSRGQAYDLSALYDAVNREYFSGSLTPPELCWSRRQAVRRTGYYDPMKNTITLSLALDDPGVPEYVVRFILYHEMLHQEARFSLMEEKRRVHDAAFRKAERRFAQYEEATAYLETLARRGSVP